MKKISVSFRYRLFAAFLVVSMIPMLLCAVSLVQVAKLRFDTQASAQSEEDLSRLVAGFDDFCNSFSQIAETLSGDETVLFSLSGGAVQSTQVYDRLFSYTEGLRSLARFDLYNAEGLLCYSTQHLFPQQSLSTDWGVLKLAVKPGQMLKFEASEDGDGNVLRCAAMLSDGEGRTVGYLVAQFSKANLAQLFANRHGAQSSLFLLSRYWRPVYSTRDVLSDQLAGALRDRLLAGQSLEGLSDSYLYHAARHEPSGLTFILQSPHIFSVDTLRILQFISMACAMVCLILSVLLSLQFSRRLFSPVQQLHDAIGQVEKNNLDIYVPTSRGDEFGQLAQHFNAMVCAMKRNQEQLVENQKELNATQIRMLQAQLNPHFLCNTLDTMKWISKINQVPQVATMSTDLADILRFSISPEEFALLSKEADILERYVEIQRLRLSDAFTFSMEIPTELEDCLVPKMILQPIVENAILHGLDGVTDGEIFVSAEARDGTLFISVQDNGRGLPPEMVGVYRRQSTDTTHHLGLYNVHTILRKNYGGQYGLRLANREGGGAVITACLPLRQEEQSC